MCVFQLDNDRQDYISLLKGYDASYMPIYYNSWSSYEEHGWILILERDDHYYIVRGGYCVMADDNEDRFEPEEISFEEALGEMDNMEKLAEEISGAI